MRERNTSLKACMQFGVGKRIPVVLDVAEAIRTPSVH
jgi:hypothetical protein